MRFPTSPSEAARQLFCWGIMIWSSRFLQLRKRSGKGYRRAHTRSCSLLTDAYRVGSLLIEHGNRYDGANANDWEYLRLIGSAHSRAESVAVPSRISFGSQFVVDHINPLKLHYPFIDLLQPQT